MEFNVFHVRALYYTKNFKTVHCTANSTFSLNCIVQHSVTTTEGFFLKITQQGRNM
jgi:hypothetical protein